jgi:hypothetical protein
MGLIEIVLVVLLVLAFWALSDTAEGRTGRPALD